MQTLLNNGFVYPERKNDSPLCWFLGQTVRDDPHPVVARFIGRFFKYADPAQ